MIYVCTKCNKKAKSKTTGLCRKCWKESISISDKPIQDFKSTPLNKKTHIRNHARKLYKRLKLPTKCFICGYDKFYEVCHIRPVYDFPNDTPIGIVNDTNNLVALCPTHHAEFDTGILELKINPKHFEPFTFIT